MGCSGSKGAPVRFTLNDVRCIIVEENAHQAVLGNQQLRAAVISVCQRFVGDKTSANIMEDHRPIAQYFLTEETLPKDLGTGDRSIHAYIGQVKVAACDGASEKLGPAIEMERPKIRTDVELQQTVRQAIKQVSDQYVVKVIVEQIEKVLAMLATRAASTAAPPVRQSSAEPQPAARDRSISQPQQQPQQLQQPRQQQQQYQEAQPRARSPQPQQSRSRSPQQPLEVRQESAPVQPTVAEEPQRAPSHATAYVQQPSQKPNAVGGSAGASGRRGRGDAPDDDEGLVPQDAANLPKGDWVKAEGTPYYYSAGEKLYFHPPSHQFYDPANDMWYDPDKDEWYADDEQN